MNEENENMDGRKFLQHGASLVAVGADGFVTLT